MDSKEEIKLALLIKKLIAHNGDKSATTDFC